MSCRDKQMTSVRREAQSPRNRIGFSHAHVYKSAVLLNFILVNAVMLIVGKVPDGDKKMLSVRRDRDV